MMQLPLGWSALRWKAPTQLIRSLALLPLLSQAYARSSSTGLGYVGYAQGDLFPRLTTLEPGGLYLVKLLAPYDLMGAEPAPAGAFASFAGFVDAGDSGAVSTPIIPVSTVSASTSSYPFNNQVSIEVRHNLGRRVLVQVFDTTGRQIDASVTTNDMNTVTVAFSQPLSGNILLY